MASGRETLGSVYVKGDLRICGNIVINSVVAGQRGLTVEGDVVVEGDVIIHHTTTATSQQDQVSVRGEFSFCRLSFHIERVHCDL